MNLKTFTTHMYHVPESSGGDCRRAARFLGVLRASWDENVFGPELQSFLWSCTVHCYDERIPQLAILPTTS